MNKIDRRHAIRALGALSAVSLCSPSWAVSADEWKNFDELYIKPPWYPNGERFVEDTPGSIVEENRIKLGIFREPCRNMNIFDSRVFKGGKLRWYGAPKLQEWVGYGMTHRDWYFGMIIMDLELLSFATLYALDRRTGLSFSHDSIDSGKNSAVAATMWNDKTYMAEKDFNMEFIHDLANKQHRIKIDIKEKKEKPGVKMDLVLRQDMSKFDPLVVSMPISPKHYMYTHKAVMGVEGNARIGDETIQYRPDIDLIAADEFKSYWPLPKRWTWGTAAGKSAEDMPVALNMVDYFTTDQRFWNENCLWIDGKLSLLGPVKWELDPRDPMKPWRMRELSGRAAADFHPEAGKTVSLGPLGFKYYQKCGRYEGYVIDDHGRKHHFDNLYGPAENGKIG